MTTRLIARLLAVPLLLALANCAAAPQGMIDSAAAREGRAALPFDTQSLGEIMLSVGGPDEAVAYFRDALAADPGNAGLRRGYARALARNRQYGEARLVWRALEAAPGEVAFGGAEPGGAASGGAASGGAASGRAASGLEPADRVDYALVLARLEQWDDAEAQLALVPSGAQGPREALARALIADQRGDWAAADVAYARARGLAAQPSATLNNWGVSLMARGDFAAAERRFEEALTFEPALFSAKNNLAITYGLQRRYRLPLVSLTEEERAILLHNMGVIALRQGDRDTGRNLLEQSLAAHPQFYAPAADKLAALGVARS